MRATWLIARKDISIQVRSGTVLTLGFVAPLLLAFIMNLVFGGLDDPDAPVTFDVAVVDLDGGPAAARFRAVIDEVAASGLLEVTHPADVADLRRAIDGGEVGAGWVVPDGFSDAVANGTAVELTVIADVDSPTTASVARAIAGQYASGVGSATLAALVAVDTGVVDPADAAAVAEEAAALPPTVNLVASDAAGPRLDTATALMGGLALFFLFFIAGLPIVNIIEERSSGSLTRLRMAPIPARVILAGKALAAIVLGTFCLLALMVASTLIMGADWGPPGPAVLLAGAAVFGATGIMSVAGSTARTSEQAGSAQAIVAIVLGIAGGAFTPNMAGGFMARLQHFTPHGWFLEGLEASAGGGWTGVLPAVGVLVMMGLVAGAVGARLAHRVVAR